MHDALVLKGEIKVLIAYFSSILGDMSCSLEKKKTFLFSYAVWEKDCARNNLDKIFIRHYWQCREHNFVRYIHQSIIFLSFILSPVRTEKRKIYSMGSQSLSDRTCRCTWTTFTLSHNDFVETIFVSEYHSSRTRDRTFVFDCRYSQ